MEGFKIVGKNVPRLDAEAKVTGRGKFSADFMMRGMLYAKVLRSSRAHAKILNINTSKAKSLSGVRAVITPEDISPVPISPLLGDQYALCSDNIVRCIGDPVAAVAADTIDICEEAIDLIDVEYDEMPAVYDVEEAFTNPSVIVHPNLSNYKVLSGLPIRLDPERPNACQTYKIRKGNVELGFQEADLIVENRFTTSRVQHAQMEPHIADAWLESDGTLTVRSSCQFPHLLKGWLMRLFNLPNSKVRVLSTYIGGGFGGKGGIRAEPIAALMARKTRRPVRFLFTREEMFAFGGHRAACIIDIKDGVRRDGTLVAREIRFIADLGAYSDWGPLHVRRAAIGAVGTYRIPNFKLDSYGVYTNLPLTAPLRGLGCPEIEWPIEQQMDMIAKKLEIDPVEIRKKNILNEGEIDVSGMVTHSIGVKECLDKVVEWIGWSEKSVKEGISWKKGKGIAIGNKSVPGGQTSVVIVKVLQDGTVEVRHSAVHLGQGVETTLAQIAAEEFGVPLEWITVVSGDTIFCPYDFGTVGSRSLIANGNALKAACQNCKQQLFRIAAPKLGVSSKDLEAREGKIFVKAEPERSLNLNELFNSQGISLTGGEILGIGSFTTPIEPENPETGQSKRSVFNYSHTANAVEVAVNVETGEVRVLRSGMACDVGKAINPKIVEGQIDGGIGMGIGITIFEEIVLEKGTVMNNGFTDYHIPTTLDMPRWGNSKAIIVEVSEPEGPDGAKGVGELTLVATAPAIANAVYNAVGIRVKDLPLSKEKIWMGLRKMGEDLSRP